MLNWCEGFFRQRYEVSIGEEKMDKPMMRIGNTLLSLWVKPLNNDSINRY